MRKILFFIVIFIVLITLTFCIMNVKSIRLTKEAKVLFNNCLLEESKQRLESALKYNMFNKRALSFKHKLIAELTNLENLEKAKKLYILALDMFNKKMICSAYKGLLESYILTSKVSEDTVCYEKLFTFKDSLFYEMNRVIDNINMEYKNQALEKYNKNSLVEAYELLDNIEFKDKSITFLMSNIAFKIGLNKYNAMLNSDFHVNKMLFLDAIYWFSQVEETSDYYKESNYYRKILNKYLVGK